MKSLVSLVAGLCFWAGLAGCTYNVNKACVIETFADVCRIENKKEKDGEDYWQTPGETLRLKTGDCEDKDFLLKSLLFRQGIKTEVVFGLLDEYSEEGHTWIEYGDRKGELWILDPVYKVIVAKKSVGNKTYIERQLSLRNIEKYIEYNDREINEIEEEIKELEEDF